MKNLISMVMTTCILQNTCANERFQNSQKNDNFLFVSDATVNIISSCYAKDFRNVILAGSCDDTVISSIHESKNALTVTIQNSPCMHDGQIQLVRNPPLFVLVTTSLSDLERRIAVLKTCPLWNINQPHFILDRFTDTNGCRNALRFLRLTWTSKLLFTIFVCYQDSHVMLYTFNPFTKIASQSWNSVLDSGARQVRPWTLYNQSYRKVFSSKFCTNLHWDKTMQLNGYKVKATGLHAKSLLMSDPDNRDMNKFSGIDGDVIRNIFAVMNVNVSVSIPTPVPSYIVNGNPYGLFKQLSSGQQDFSLNSQILQSLKNCTMPSSLHQSGLKFVVQKKMNRLSTFEKIVQYLGLELIGITIVIALMTIMVLRHFPKQPMMNSTLEVVRLLANGSLVKPPLSTAGRMYLGPVLFYFLIFQGIFQGKLASLLTNPVNETNLNTLDDLKTHSKYKLYCGKYFFQYIDDELKPRTTFIEGYDCENYTLNDPHAVCIMGYITAESSAATKNLHLSQDFIVPFLGSYFMNINWPLQNRFNRLVAMAIESYLVTVWGEKWRMPLLRRILKSEEEYNTSAEHVPIALENLGFALQCLAFGLCCATLVFLIEIKFWKIIKNVLPCKIMSRKK